MSQRAFFFRISAKYFEEMQDTTTDGVGILQDELQRAVEEKVVMADEAKAEAQDLQATISLLKADLAKQEQVVEAQRSHLQADLALKTQLSELAQQLEQQEKIAAAKEEQVTKVNAAKDAQLEVAAALNSDLTQVQAGCHLYECTDLVVRGMPHYCKQKHLGAHPDEQPVCLQWLLQQMMHQPPYVFSNFQSYGHTLLDSWQTQSKHM